MIQIINLIQIKIILINQSPQINQEFKEIIRDQPKTDNKYIIKLLEKL
jgi:hypothetical protein